MCSTNVAQTRTTPRNTHFKPTPTTHGNYKGRRTSKAKTSCFINLKNKIDDLFQAVKRLANRVIEKIEDLLYLAETKISESAEEAHDGIKNIKNPFRKNDVDIKIGKLRIQANVPAKIKDFFCK